MEALNDFERTVKAMRYYQAMYFKSRDGRMLERSKEYEKRVDDYLKAKEEAYRQPVLFPEKEYTGHHGEMI